MTNQPRTGPHRAATTAALALTTLAATAGCTSTPAPNPAVSATAARPPTATAAGAASTSARTSQAPTPPTSSRRVDPVLARIPAAARPNTMAGAEAFARFFIEQVALSGVTADPELIAGLYQAACGTCANFAATGEYFRRTGQHHRTPSLTVTSSSANSFVPNDVHIAVWVILHAVEIVDSKGSPVGTTESGEGAFVLALRHDGHWVVTSVGVERH